jgi:hypothetical protein
LTTSIGVHNIPETTSATTPAVMWCTAVLLPAVPLNAALDASYVVRYNPVAGATEETARA